MKFNEKRYLNERVHVGPINVKHYIESRLHKEQLCYRNQSSKTNNKYNNISQKWGIVWGMGWDCQNDCYDHWSVVFVSKEILMLLSLKTTSND